MVIGQKKIRNSVDFPINLNVMIRETDEFFIQVTDSSPHDQATKLVFSPRETKVINLVYMPKTNKPSKGKLVLKPINVKIGGKIIKASIGLKGVPGASDIR